MLVNDRCFLHPKAKFLRRSLRGETAEITHDGSSYPVKSSSKLC